MNLNKLEKDIISIINGGIKNLNSFSSKRDNSIVTNADTEIENTLINYIKNLFPGIRIISEENPISHSDEYKLENKFAIIDPIDGTENFYFLDNIFGSAISIVYNKINYHLIYIPKSDKIFSTLSDFSSLKNHSKIELFSTSCVDHLKGHKNRQAIRVLGSSTYMFFSLLTGKAYSFSYCGGAKIWDYYTGISLALITNKFNVRMGNKIIKRIPKVCPHLSNFLISHNE